MPLTGNPSHDIKAELNAGKPRKQAIAIALNTKRSKNYSKGAVAAALQRAGGNRG